MTVLCVKALVRAFPVLRAIFTILQIKPLFVLPSSASHPLTAQSSSGLAVILSLALHCRQLFCNHAFLTHAAGMLP